MNKDDIIRMAREAGLPHWYEDNTLVNESRVLKFAALVADAEREECAKVCDGIRYSGYCPPENGSAPDYYDEAAAECAAAIRARGEQK